METFHLDPAVSEAVSYYWSDRTRQQAAQAGRQHTDQGARSAVTGGTQMDGFVRLVSRYLVAQGVDEKHIHTRSKVQLPGFFRPTKEWDLLVVREGRLLVALEAKSQAGPSFGNNFNNRTEEAMGSALDLWTAFREGVLNEGIAPFLGYIFHLEECPSSQSPVKVQEPHFKVMREFVDSSYARRYELFCRKLVRERCYSAAAFVTSRRDSGLQGLYSEPAADLGFAKYMQAIRAALVAHEQ